MIIKDIVETEYSPTRVEAEIRNRIRLSVAAYSYEFENVSILSDGAFDALCLALDVTIETGNIELDFFFETEFEPCTGVWVHWHPDLEGLRYLYWKHYVGKKVY